MIVKVIKFISFFLSLAISDRCISQNLILNGSFEYYNQCPFLYSQNKYSINTRTIEYAVPWKQPSYGTSDLITGCDPDALFPLPRIGFEDGKACAGILLTAAYRPSQIDTTGCVKMNYREYLQTKLDQTLLTGIRYKFNMWVLPASGNKIRTDAIGAYFTSNAISSPDTVNHNNNIVGYPQIQNRPGNFLTDTTKWTLIQGVFTSQGDEVYVTIGNFEDDDHTTISGLNGENPQLMGCRNPTNELFMSYYYVDNISLIACGTETKSDLGIDTTSICFGHDSTVLSPRISNSQIQYIWNTGSLDSNLVVTTPGNYSVKIVLNDNDCLLNDTLLKTYIVTNSQHNQDTSLCYNYLNGYTNYSDFYDKILAYKSPNSTKTISIFDTSGTFYIKPYAQQYCNVKLRKLTIYPYQTPPLYIQPSSLCQSDTFQISVSTVNSNIQWNIDLNLRSNLINKYTIEVVNPRSQFVSATLLDEHGCKTTTQELLLTQGIIPTLTITPEKANICAGQQILLNAETNANYLQWSNRSTANSLNVSSAGYYKVSVWDDPGCKKSDSVYVNTIPLPIFKFTSDTSYCFGELIPLVLKAPLGYKNYIWNTETISGNTFSFSQGGTLNFKVVDTNNCVAISRITLINSCEDPLLPNVFTPNGDMVNELFEIKNLLPQTELSIFNRWGSKVFVSENYRNDWKAEGCENGIYYYQLYNSFYRSRYKGWVEVIR